MLGTSPTSSVLIEGAGGEPDLWIEAAAASGGVHQGSCAATEFQPRAAALRTRFQPIDGTTKHATQTTWDATLAVCVACVLLAVRNSEQSQPGGDSGVALEVKVEEVNSVITDCKATPTKACRNETLDDGPFRHAVPREGSGKAVQRSGPTRLPTSPGKSHPSSCPSSAKARNNRLPILLPASRHLQDRVSRYRVKQDETREG